MSKTLVAYFSASGETKRLAQTLADVTKADIFEIEPTELYSSADLNWMDKKSRSTIEMKDKASRPAITNRLDNIEEYETIYIGFPIWWYIAPRIIQTFLESYDFSNKTIIPFATSGGSGMGKTNSVLYESLPESVTLLEGKVISSQAKSSQVEDWVNKLTK